jgi:hypothetical protein
MSDEYDAVVSRAEDAVDAPADEGAHTLPAWMRGVFALFTALFGGLAVWLARMAADAGPGALVGAVASGALALLLLVAAVRGKVWKWLWLILPG